MGTLKKLMGNRLKVYIIARGTHYQGEGKVIYVFDPPPFLTDQFCKIVRPIFRKKRPLQAKKFWGPFFQEIDIFRKI